MARLSDNMRAAVYMMLSMAGFLLNDTCVKLVSVDLPLFQTILVRGVIATALVGLVVGWQGAFAARIGPRDVKIIAFRTAGEIGATICFLLALFNMPIANATAIMQSAPLAVTLGAALVLGERVGWRRYVAIGVGFVGVLIIVRPGSDGFTQYSLYAMVAVVFMVARDLSTRRLSPSVPALAVTFCTAAGITAVAALMALVTDWAPVEPAHLGLLCAAAIFLLVGYLFGIKTMRLGEIGFAQVFRYTLLIWAILAGIVVFGEWPDAWMLAGSALVVGMGVFTVYRERQQQRREPAAARVLDTAPPA